MKKLKKIKLNIEKDVISSLSIDDQLQIKGGGDYIGPTGAWNDTRYTSWDINLCPRDDNPTGNYNPKPTIKACPPPATNNCIPTGSAFSEVAGYNCYTYNTLCDC